MYKDNKKMFDQTLKDAIPGMTENDVERWINFTLKFIEDAPIGSKYAVAANECLQLLLSRQERFKKYVDKYIDEYGGLLAATKVMKPAPNNNIEKITAVKRSYKPNIKSDQGPPIPIKREFIVNSDYSSTPSCFLNHNTPIKYSSSFSISPEMPFSRNESTSRTPSIFGNLIGNDSISEQNITPNRKTVASQRVRDNRIINTKHFGYSPLNNNSTILMDLERVESSTSVGINNSYFKSNDDEVINIRESRKPKEFENPGPIRVLNEEIIRDLLTTDNRINLIKENRKKAEAEQLVNVVLRTLDMQISTSKKNKTTLDTPTNINAELKPYQKVGLAWLVGKELDYPCGGILADEMGLGKTLQMISLIVYQKQNLSNNSMNSLLCDKVASKMNLKLVKATLIICPSCLLSQWVSEIQRFVKDDFLSVYVFHGSNRTQDINKLSNDLILRDETDDDFQYRQSIFLDGKMKNNKKLPKNANVEISTLLKMSFRRVILDEAHYIRNKQTKLSRAVARLSAFNRWCVTGTPLNNYIWDIYSLIRFLRIYPLDQSYIWSNKMQENPEDFTQINVVTESLMLRRCKNEKCPLTGGVIVDIPKKEYEEIKIKFSEDEKKIYDKLYECTKFIVTKFLNDHSLSSNIRSRMLDGSINPFSTAQFNIRENKKDEMRCILVLIMRLRQACSHLSLTVGGLNMEAFGFVNERDLIQTETLVPVDGNSSVNNDTTYNLKCFDPEFKSTKMIALFERIDKIISLTDEKILIISEWVGYLDLLEARLKGRSIPYNVIKGEVKHADRTLAQNELNDKDGSARVMLLSLKAGGVGLNLNGANHVFIMDLHWNPFLENQGIDRVHRIGQDKHVKVYKFVVEGSIEEKVLKIQELKQDLSKALFGEAPLDFTRKATTVLPTDDLGFLFDQ
uniref:Helicase ATP-binding domain-containing protein n=1 Tax=Parastrongyloides trichosuri TaxID=131310 RepID=A0A0N5A201_PARTI